MHKIWKYRKSSINPPVSNKVPLLELQFSKKFPPPRSSQKLRRFMTSLVAKCILQLDISYFQLMQVSSQNNHFHTHTPLKQLLLLNVWSSLISQIHFNLSSGFISETHVSILSSFCTASAVCLESPVSIAR